MISGNLSIRYGFKGPNIAVVTACTTGTHNIGIGGRMIQYGDADVMVVGGAEQATSPITMAAFASMKALSSRNDEPERASRPWDRIGTDFCSVTGPGHWCSKNMSMRRRVVQRFIANSPDSE